MHELSLRLVLEVGAIAILAATAGFFLISAAAARDRSRDSVFRAEGAGTVFLFDGEALLDATPSARRLLAVSQQGARGGPWARLMAYLAPRFPGCEEQLRHLVTEGALLLHAAGQDAGGLTLNAQYGGGLTRITLSDLAEAPGDPLAYRAQTAELAELRAAMSAAPFMAWREAGAEVVWANAAYLAAALHRLPPGDEIGWPLPRLFPSAAEARARLEDGKAGLWFDLRHFDDAGGDRLVFAMPIDGAVQAETALREFKQTLTRTFADLPIGLAIFDRQRQLAMFNPALMDLSGLQPDFLSRRPTLFAVLDAMRDRSMIPEPKDYRGWRNQMTDLEKAASSGGYEETWSLPSGQTYRVIGRPHPNGALALMFEDISTEMTRTRRYRADLELGQSVIDAMDEAIVVFSQGGQLVMSNAAYSDLWHHDPAGGLGDEGIAALCGHWRRMSVPTPLWAEAEHFVVSLGPREAQTGIARLTDGRAVQCRMTPLPGGATLVGFRVVIAEAEPARIAV
ncbi:PAS-domain containing protein [Cereibacter sp. SYSU M97828]|nr:PAS-domain containing protein [Cereibacter flavus]